MRKISLSMILLIIMVGLVVHSCKNGNPKSPALKKKSVTGLSRTITQLQTQKKIALVIGNGNYPLGTLANPENDARSMTDVLRKLGFKVYPYENLNAGQMKRAIDDFGTKLKGNDVGLFYYAGHGIQAKGYNYLIPVDAQLQTEEQVEYDCVRADRVLSLMETSETKVNVIILDACRNNPFERSWTRSATGKGLAFMSAPKGTLIAYATAPGSTASDGSGKNGLYTSAILESIQIPDLTINQIFQNVGKIVLQKSNSQQIPWTASSLTADFYFILSDSISNSNYVIGEIEELSSFGNIELTTEISGDLYLDGKKLTTVSSNSKVPINKVPIGSHKLEIVGNENWTKNVIITKDNMIPIKATSINSGVATKLDNSGMLVDKRDGNKYKWIKIGNQIWMAENLKTTKYRNGDLIGTTTSVTKDISYESTPKCQWAYYGDESNVDTYGRLYTWYAVTDRRGVCPTGWHVPTDGEWTTLTRYLGGESIAGGKLKEKGTLHWKSPNSEASNETYFTALPGGGRSNNGAFGGITGSGFWWSSTESSSASAWGRGMLYDYGNVHRNYSNERSGFSVRCIKDN